MQRIYYIFLSTIVVLSIFITVFSSENYSISASFNINKEYYWPTPGFMGISSKFGYRNKPTNGASTYHKGIDILAYQGSSVYAIADGVVNFAAFDNSGGYMIVIKHEENIKSSYAHLDSKMYVNIGDNVKKGELIGRIGPKYIEDGRLNGATTGVHLHLGIQANGEYVDPLKLF